jgi:hypothetical protein
MGYQFNLSNSSERFSQAENIPTLYSLQNFQRNYSYYYYVVIVVLPGLVSKYYL